MAHQIFQELLRQVPVNANLAQAVGSFIDQHPSLVSDVYVVQEQGVRLPIQQMVNGMTNNPTFLSDHMEMISLKSTIKEIFQPAAQASKDVKKSCIQLKTFCRAVKDDLERTVRTGQVSIAGDPTMLKDPFNVLDNLASSSLAQQHIHALNNAIAIIDSYQQRDAKTDLDGYVTLLAAFDCVKGQGVHHFQGIEPTDDFLI